jgi:hypothetical protein
MTKEQKKEYNKNYWAKNKERFLSDKDKKEYARAYYHAHKERYAEKGRIWHEANKPRLRENWLKWNYGITQLDYDRLYQIQQGCCAICKTHQKILKRTLSVDHCHKTNRVRGLLCFACNTVLGGVSDSIEKLESAIDYLKMHI